MASLPSSPYQSFSSFFPILDEPPSTPSSSLPPFTVTLSRGFLPLIEPLATLPASFARLTSLLERMPIKTASGAPGLLATFTFGETLLKELPDLTDQVDAWKNDLEVMNALYRDYSFVVSAYLLEPCHKRRMEGLRKGEDGYGLGRERLPSVVARPLKRVADILGFKPFMEYAGSYALYNYRLELPARGLEYDNLRLIRAFEHGLDPQSSEAGFVLVHVAMVKHSGALVKGAVQSLDACLARERVAFEKGLSEVVDAMREVNGVMNTMWNKSKPAEYTSFRTFIFGITSQSMFPNGVVYEGVSEKALSYRGESGANDSMIPLVDNLLEIVMPQTPLTAILHDFRQYRPGNHREFLAAVQQCAEVAGVQEFALSQSSSAELYLRILDQVREFRWRHWCFVKEYVLRRTKYARATGGSPIVTWLPNQLQAVLETMAKAGGCCQDVKGVGDILETVVRQQETLAKEVERYCGERGMEASEDAIM